MIALMVEFLSDVGLCNINTCEQKFALGLGLCVPLSVVVVVCGEIFGEDPLQT